MSRTFRGAHETSPENWLKLVMEDCDFERAFRALSGYDHFHTSTLRGKMLMHMLRPAESWMHFDRAERVFRRIESPTERELTLFFYRFVYRFDNASFSEAVRSTPASRTRTDRMIRELLEFDCPASRIIDQIRVFSIACFHLMRGDYRTGLELFEKLLEESRLEYEDQRAGFFLGAAACAKELGLDGTAESHLENASLSTNMIGSNFKQAIFYARLYTILMRWDRPEEARTWQGRLERLECSPRAKRFFALRAKYLTVAARESDRLLLA